MIDLSTNNIGDKGTKAFPEALKVNTSLKYIDLERNRIDNEGAIAIVDALRVNRTLEQIDLYNNDIFMFYIERIKKLKKNKEMIKNN